METKRNTDYTDCHTDIISYYHRERHSNCLMCDVLRVWVCWETEIHIMGGGYFGASHTFRVVLFVCFPCMHVVWALEQGQGFSSAWIIGYWDIVISDMWVKN